MKTRHKVTFMVSNYGVKAYCVLSKRKRSQKNAMLKSIMRKDSQFYFGMLDRYDDCAFV